MEKYRQHLFLEEYGWALVTVGVWGAWGRQSPVLSWESSRGSLVILVAAKGNVA